MKTVLRKSLLYKTGVEYGDYTINHIQGCSHGCKFPCYAMMMAKRFGKSKTYDDWCEPKIVSNALEILNKEIPKYKDDIKSVQLCFTTDPFMYGIDEVKELSLQIIGKLNENGIKCTVLTKGVLPIELANYSHENEYGITLVSLDEKFRLQYECNTAPYHERIAALRALHDAGFQTWVSVEPYPTPNMCEQDLAQILEAISFVDKIIFGRIHYNKMATAYKQHKEFFNDAARQVIAFCNEHNIVYHIKKGTLIGCNKSN